MFVFNYLMGMQMTVLSPHFWIMLVIVVAIIMTMLVFMRGCIVHM